jgi:hypothetical protein
MDINERARTDPRSSRSIFDHTSARTAVAAALLCLAAAAPACPDLTGADAVTPGSRFLLDNEGYAATPWNLQISGVGANGDVTGTMTTNVYGGTTYPVFGTVSGSGTLEIAFTYVVGGIPGITFDGVTYSYNGAIMYADAACDLFIAGDSFRAAAGREHLRAHAVFRSLGADFLVKPRPGSFETRGSAVD